MNIFTFPSRQKIHIRFPIKVLGESSEPLSTTCIFFFFLCVLKSASFNLVMLWKEFCIIKGENPWESDWSSLWPFRIVFTTAQMFENRGLTGRPGKGRWWVAVIHVVISVVQTIWPTARWFGWHLSPHILFFILIFILYFIFLLVTNVFYLVCGKILKF